MVKKSVKKDGIKKAEFLMMVLALASTVHS